MPAGRCNRTVAHLLIATMKVKHVDEALMEAGTGVLRAHHDFDTNPKQMCHKLRMQLSISPHAISHNCVHAFVVAKITHSLQ
jgi:hypothetical protein